MDVPVTYLRMAPEFGGTRYGPFDALEVRLGSNADACDVALPASLGLFPIHVKLVRQSRESFVLVPSDRTAGVFLTRAGVRSVQPIITATAVAPGDSFALVTAEGPRFVIEGPEPAAPAQKGRITGKGLAAEGKRQIWTRLLVTGPAQLAQRAYVFVSSGAFYQPRYLFLYAAMLGGWIFGGVQMCGSRRATALLDSTVMRTETCESELGICQNMSGDATEYSFEELAGAITGLGEPLVITLREDPILRAAVEKKTSVHLTDAAQWKWLVHSRARKAAEFAEWRTRITKAVEAGSIDAGTGRLVVWLAAQPGDIESDFLDGEDSESKAVCVRGPLAIGYRHGLHLGLAVQPDALVGVTASDRPALLRQTILAANGPPLPDPLETALDPIRQGRSGCVYATGDDERTDPAALATMLAKSMGPGAALVPSDSVSFGPAARVAKFWAGDLARVDYGAAEPGIDLSKTQVGTALEAYEGPGQWVLARTADTIAKAIAVPCLMALQGQAEDAKRMLGETGVPSAIQCLVLDWRIRNAK